MLLKQQKIMSNNIQNIDNVDNIFKTVNDNLFRSLPIINKNKTNNCEDNNEENEIISDPQWQRLQPIYELFYNLITDDKIDENMLKKHITYNFIQKLLSLFNSEDVKEREYLKSILHSIYAKVISRRKIIRKLITYYFHNFIYDSLKINGASEILNVLTSIICGFATPLRHEHIHFFKTVIIPLHKGYNDENLNCPVSELYLSCSEQLLKCSLLFIDKEKTLAVFLINGLLKYWPCGNFEKEILFLSELSEIVKLIDLKSNSNTMLFEKTISTLFEKTIPTLFKRLAKCLASQHIRVIEKVISFFDTEQFILMIEKYKNIIFPIINPVIQQIENIYSYMNKTQWYELLQLNVNDIKKILKNIDNVLYNKTTNTTISNNKENNKNEEKWKILISRAILMTC